MITIFARKRNVNTNLPFFKNFTTIEVHSNGSQTFKFDKKIIGPLPPVSNYKIKTENGLFLTNQVSQLLTTG
jgi:hypothetical protein